MGALLDDWRFNEQTHQGEGEFDISLFHILDITTVHVKVHLFTHDIVIIFPQQNSRPVIFGAVGLLSHVDVFGDFLRCFLKHYGDNTRDTTTHTYGYFDTTSQKYMGNNAQLLNILAQCAIDIMYCLRKFLRSREHSCNLLAYARWYMQKFPKSTTKITSYRTFITYVTCKCITDVDFRIPKTWSLIEF